MQYKVDADARIVEFDTVGLSSQRVNDGFLAFIDDQPELWHWDWIIKVDQVPADTTVSGAGRLAARYANMDKTQAVTVMVSPDSNLQFWAKVLEFQYPGRRRHVVPQRTDALCLIAECRGVPR